jgi:XRE family transcriptional regulator, regulator of sulfur utilization
MGPLDRDVGAKIRAFRMRKKLTLNELSRLTRIAASNLSSMELGKSSPTLSTLVKIADAFGVKAGVFLDEVLYRKAVLCRRSDTEVRERAADTLAWDLTHGVWLNRLHVEILEIRSGGKLQLQPEGRDRFLYCLQGDLTARMEDESNFLREGDGLYVMPEASILLENETAAEISALLIWPKGEDA